jgi:hypothetical protein
MLSCLFSVRFAARPYCDAAGAAFAEVAVPRTGDIETSRTASGGYPLGVGGVVSGAITGAR